MKYRKKLVAAGILALSSIAAAAGLAEPAGVTAFVRDRHLTRYNVAFTDLDGDKQPEALVYAMATTDGGGQADLCGSGGCNLYVLSLTPTSYRLVTAISLTRPSINVLPSISHGWHDLGVWVAGGGITTGYEARLRFDGHSYPSNPTGHRRSGQKTKAGKTVIGTMPTNS